MPPPVKRQYNTTRRQEQARETRLRIIRAAHEHFVAQGYGRTTIAEIAASAGVSVETVYAAFRNKPTLLRQVWYVNFRGDEKGIRMRLDDLGSRPSVSLSAPISCQQGPGDYPAVRICSCCVHPPPGRRPPAVPSVDPGSG